MNAPTPSGPAGLPPCLTGELPYLTADLPGVGGVLKEEIADFDVEEIPAYAPEGSGEFLFLWVEKRGLSAEQLTSHLAKFLGIAHQDIGTAGLKDRQAVTRQMVSVPARCEPRLADIRHPQITLLSAARHRNKLRTGHLRGNRFAIRIRRPQPSIPEALARAEAIAARVRTLGFPNYFGDQRFGRDAETLLLGLDLLNGRRQPADIPRARRKFLLRLALSAAQSALFNQLLAERIRAGTLHTVEPGDVMQVVASGGPFVAEDAAREQPRLEAREIVVSGPLFGPKMKPAAGAPGAREAAVLQACGLSADNFTAWSKLTSGTRRPYLIWPADLALTADAAGLLLSFTLPAGCYATMLLREFQKA